MIVVKKQNEAFEPQTGTLWVDGGGVVYFLHRVVSSNEGRPRYQLTRLEDGCMKATSVGNKTDLIHGMALCSCSVEIRNWGEIRKESENA